MSDESQRQIETLKARLTSEPKANAGNILKGLDNHSEPLLQFLFTSVTDSNPTVRENVALALAETKDKRSVNFLIKLLSDACEDVIDTTQKVLLAFGEDIVTPLIIAMKDAQFGHLSNIALTLGRTGSQLALKPLVQLLAHEDDQIRYAAAIALGYLGNKSALEPLVRSLESPNVADKSSAAIALSILGDERAVAPLIKALEDERPNVQYPIVIALSKFGNSNALTALMRLQQNYVGSDRAFQRLLAKSINTIKLLGEDLK